MASTKRSGLPEFWTTTIAKALSGDQPCLLAAWLSGHYRLDKRQRENGAELAIWKTNHTAQLQAHVEKMKAEGWKCSVERFFKVTGQAAIISGKADLVVQQTDKRPRIIDIKSGTPRESDVLQVMIEMVMIPHAWNSPGMIFDGEVVYDTHTVAITPAQADQVKPRIFAMLKHLGLSRPPDAAPSSSACRFCDVSSADCPDREDADDSERQPVPVEMELF